MTEITKLENKYFVVKQEDLDNALNKIGANYFMELLLEIENVRKKKGKEIIYPSYLVLNLDDEISIPSLNAKIQDIITTRMYQARFGAKINPSVTVRDIALVLVNAILKAKEKK